MAHPLYEILQRLDFAGIHYHLGRYRDDVVTVHVTVVGGRHEIDVDSDGNVDTSFFNGSEDLVQGMDAVESIIADNSDHPEGP